MKLVNDVITIFNHRIDDDKGYDVWEPTSIRGCHWYASTDTTVTTDGLMAAAKYTIRIPEDATVLYGKTYVDPVAYLDADPTSSWTLQNGDLVVLGTETSRMTPKEISEKHGTYATIVGVTDNRRAPQAPHWRVVGK